MTHSNHMVTIHILQTAEISKRKIVFLVRAGKESLPNLKFFAQCLPNFG